MMKIDSTIRNSFLNLDFCFYFYFLFLLRKCIRAIPCLSAYICVFAIFNRFNSQTIKAIKWKLLGIYFLLKFKRCYKFRDSNFISSITAQFFR